MMNQKPPRLGSVLHLGARYNSCLTVRERGPSRGSGWSQIWTTSASHRPVRRVRKRDTYRILWELSCGPARARAPPRRLKGCTRRSRQHYATCSSARRSRWVSAPRQVSRLARWKRPSRRAGPSRARHGVPRIYRVSGTTPPGTPRPYSDKPRKTSGRSNGVGPPLPEAAPAVWAMTSGYGARVSVGGARSRRSN